MFKVGKTSISIMEELAKERNTIISEVEEAVYIKISDKDIFSLVPNSKDKSKEFASMCSSTKVYLVGKIEVASIPVEKVYLTFYNNILTSYYSDISTDFSSALITKYGTPTIIKQEKAIVCRNAYNEFINKDITYNKIWTNGDIKAVETFMNYHNESCKERVKNFFTITNAPLHRKAALCDYQWTEKYNSQNRSKQENKLKDF